MTVDLAKLSTSSRYSITASTDQILADLDQLEQIDKFAEEKRKFYGLIQVAAWTATAIGLIGGLVLFDTGTTLIPLVITASALALVTALWARSSLKPFAKLDLPDYRYLVLRKMLQMLSRDAGLLRDFTVHLNFVQPAEATKVFPHPYRPNWRVRVYYDTWLILRGKLLDGSRFKLTLTERSVDHCGRNINNKERTKPRTKGLEIRLKVTCPQDRYQTLANFEQVPPQIKLSPGIQLRYFRIMGNTIRLRLSITAWTPLRLMAAEELKRKLQTLTNNQALRQALGSVAPEDTQQVNRLYQGVTLAFLNVYQLLNLVRVTSKQAS